MTANATNCNHNCNHGERFNCRPKELALGLNAHQGAPRGTRPGRRPESRSPRDQPPCRLTCGPRLPSLPCRFDPGHTLPAFPLVKHWLDPLENPPEGQFPTIQDRSLPLHWS